MNRFRRALKQLTMRHPSSSRTISSMLLPSTMFNYRAVVGDGRRSSIIMICANWIARTLPEAPLSVQELDADGHQNWLPQHPFTALMRNPNPHYTGVQMMMAAVIDIIIDGNAYILKTRSRLGKTVELWYAPSFLMEPKWKDGYIDFYEYKYDPVKKPLEIPVEDVQHIRWGIDPENTRKGQSQLKPIIREVFTDEEAANFTASLLRNMGIPGIIISPASDDDEADADDILEVKETFMRRYGGDKRGEPLVLRKRTQINILSFSPADMDLRGLRRVSEERVSAILGLPAIVAGLGAGLDRSTFANFQEAREAAFDALIRPLQLLIAADLTRDLLRDFDANINVSVVFDNRLVSILQQQINKKRESWRQDFREGLITRAEFRAEFNLHHGPADEVYRQAKNVLEIPANEGGSGLVDQQLTAPSSGFGSSQQGLTQDDFDSILAEAIAKAGK